MTDDREVILKVENLRTWFPVKKGTFKKVVDHVKAVDDVSLEIYKGETLGIVGESGCGKSTFGKSIMRLEQITDGKVIFNYDGQFKDVAQFDKKEMFEFIALRFWAPLKEEFFIETFPCDSTISVESAENHLYFI